jgi:hypothetical protein
MEMLGKTALLVCYLLKGKGNEKEKEKEKGACCITVEKYKARAFSIK